MSRLVRFRDWDGEKIGDEFGFDKRDKPLIDFFNKRAEKFIDGRVTTIKSLYDENDNFLGYYAVSMSSIEAPDLYDEKRVATFPHPALKIGRLLVDKKLRGQKIGTAAIASIVQLAKAINRFVACRFILVDSKPWVVEFYQKNGFVVVGGEINENSSTVEMLFDLKD